MASPIQDGVYNIDYFCLTDDNYLLVKRDDDVLQIKPSEYKEGDKLQTIDKNNNIIWVNSSCSRRIVKQQEEIVNLSTRLGVLNLTPNHRLFLENRTEKAAGNMTEEDALWSVGHNILPTHKSIGIGLAYALGAYSAEGSHQEGMGSHGTGQWRLEYALHHDEDIFAARIVQSLMTLNNKIEFSPTIKKFPEYTRMIVGIYSKELTLYFKQLGVTGLCQNKRIPSCLLTATKEEKAAYIAGLFEGDGTATDRTVDITLTSKALINGLQILLSTLGINSKLHFVKSTKENILDKFALRIYGKQNLEIFIKWIGKYLFGWKHLSHITEYAKSDFRNNKYTKEEIKVLVQENFPIGFDHFRRKTGISQDVIKRLFGSWNQCVSDCGLSPRNSRWGLEYKKEIIIPQFEIDTSCIIHSKEIITLDKDIFVYDFRVPEYEKFLIGNIVSHNSSAQMAMYIGDVWVDEVTSLSFSLQQSKMPLYGYADTLYRTVSKGQVIVQGQFSINFKEAGYLWLILNRYHELQNKPTPFTPVKGGGEITTRENIEQTVTGKANTTLDYNPLMANARTTQTLNQLASYYSLTGNNAGNTVGGKGQGTNGSSAESVFEMFEDSVWGGRSSQSKLASATGGDVDDAARRCDNPAINNFDIYIAYGDFIGDNRMNHTIRKLVGVHILGMGQAIEVSGMPLQESYSFLARNLL